MNKRQLAHVTRTITDARERLVALELNDPNTAEPFPSKIVRNVETAVTALFYALEQLDNVRDELNAPRRP